MSFVIGTVNALVGQVIAVAEDGSSRTLKLGDAVLNTEVIRTVEGAQIEVALANGEAVSIANAGEWLAEQALTPQTLAQIQFQSTPIGTVNSVSGNAVAVAADGSERVLLAGDSIYPGEIIRTSPDSAIQIAVDGASPITIGGGESWVATSDTYTPTQDFDPTAAASSDIDAIQAAILAGVDPTQNAEATAAGGETPTEDGGSSFVTLERTAGEVNPEAGFDTIGLNQTNTPINEEPAFVATDPVTPTVITITATDVSSQGGTIVEGNNIVIRFTISEPSTNPITIQTNNGPVTIPAGETTADLTFLSRQDESFKQGEEVITTSVTGVTGGNGEEFEFTDAQTETTVVDDNDVTTSSISVANITENDTSVTFNFATSNAPQSGVAASLTVDVNGTEYTVDLDANGEGSLTLNNLDNADVYNDSGSYVATISSINGGNFEATQAGQSATAIITETIDVSTVTLSSVSDKSEDGLSVTYTVSVDNAASGSELDLTVTVNGIDQTVTIPDGSNSTMFSVATRTDDAYTQSDSTYNVAVTGGTGGGYESIDYSGASDSFTVTDDSDATTVTLSSSDVVEGADITITATVDNAPQTTDLILTLNNNETITIEAGKTSGSVTFANPNTADDIVDAGSQTYSITGSAGVNYESLNTSDTVVVNVSDNPLAGAVVDLSADTSVVEGTNITYTATLTGTPAGNDITVTLASGHTITIDAGQTSGSVTVSTRTDEEYVQGTVQVTNSITDVTETNSDSAPKLESLTAAADTNVSTDVSDDSDATTVTLSSSDVVEGADITITATVDNAPQTTDLVLTLNNNETITIEAGKTSGSVTFANPNTADDIVDAGSQTYSITGSVGGNYESLNTSDTVVVNVSDRLVSSVNRDLQTEDEVVLNLGQDEDTVFVSAIGGDGSYTYSFVPGSNQNVAAGDFYIDSGTGAVRFVQDDNFIHDGSISEDNNVYSINVRVTDGSGQFVDQTVYVDITDDDPVVSNATNLSVTVKYDADGSISSSSSLTDDGTVSLAPGADGWNSVSLAAAGYTLTGPDSNGTYIGQKSGQNIFSINLDVSTGDYEFELLNPDAAEQVVTNTTSDVQGQQARSSFDFEDSNGDKVTVTGILGSLQIKPTSAGLGANSGNFKSGDGIDIDLASEADGLFTLNLKNEGGADTIKITIYNGATKGSSDSFSTSSETISLMPAPGEVYDRVEVEFESVNGDLKVLSLSAEQLLIPDGEVIDFTITGVDVDLDDDSDTFSVTISHDAPIAIDLDGDGVEYLSREAGVVFTDQSTGELVNTAWVGPDDGLLVIDANNSGTIDESREYVFTEWSETAETDMEAIAEVFDTNQDGLLDAKDDQWDQFRVWQDKDSDGQTDEGELVSLGDLMIESIDLTYVADSQEGTAAYGDVVIHGQSAVTYTDGSTTIAEDTSFAISEVDLLNTEELVFEKSEDSFDKPVASAADSSVSTGDLDINDLLQKVVDEGTV